MDLGVDKIRAYKEEWEAFVSDAKKDHPQSIAMINAYGTIEEIHSARLIFQKVDGKIVLERHYHLLDGPVENTCFPMPWVGRWILPISATGFGIQRSNARACSRKTPVSKRETCIRRGTPLRQSCFM